MPESNSLEIKYNELYIRINALSISNVDFVFEVTQTTEAG